MEFREKLYFCGKNFVMETMAKKQKTDNKNMLSASTQEVKQLSKVGEWLRSGQSVGTIVDMRAVLR